MIYVFGAQIFVSSIMHGFVSKNFRMRQVFLLPKILMSAFINFQILSHLFWLAGCWLPGWGKFWFPATGTSSSLSLLIVCKLTSVCKNSNLNAHTASERMKIRSLSCRMERLCLELELECLKSATEIIVIQVYINYQLNSTIINYTVQTGHPWRKKKNYDRTNIQLFIEF